MMTVLFERLVDDHANMSRVLNCLEKAVASFDDENQEVNLGLILDALEYIQVYPESYHHPLEEHVFDYLEEYQLGDIKCIQEIRKQHSELQQQTHALVQQFDAVANDSVVPIQLLKKSFKRFVDDQRHHLETENTKIFPVLAKLSDAQWWDIASSMILHSDPIFSNEAKQKHRQFGALIDGIVAESQS